MKVDDGDYLGVNRRPNLLVPARAVRCGASSDESQLRVTWVFKVVSCIDPDI